MSDLPSVLLLGVPICNTMVPACADKVAMTGLSVVRDVEILPSVHDMQEPAAAAVHTGDSAPGLAAARQQAAAAAGHAAAAASGTAGPTDSLPAVTPDGAMCSVKLDVDEPSGSVSRIVSVMCHVLYLFA